MNDFGYFENLIQTYLLDNTHGSVVTVLPEKGRTARMDQELAEKLDPEKIHGRVIIVKTVCRKEFEERSGSICPEDKKNLNRVFP